MSKSEINMTEGRLLPKIILFSLPLMASGALQLLYNAADLVVVGRYAMINGVSAGKECLAAVGATGALINLIVNIFIGLSVGTAVVVARYIGANDANGAQRATHTSIAVAIISGIVVGLFGFFASREILIWMDTPDNVLDMATVYMKIYFIGAPANMLYNFGSAVMRAYGDTKKPLYFLTISGLTNILLNLFFVIVCGMNVDGVAMATISSQVVSAVLVILCLMKNSGPCKLEIKKISIHVNELKQIAIIGLPAGIQSSLFSISNVIIQSSINSFGDVVMSGNTAGGNIEGFINIIENAFYQAALTFTGQNYGAKKYKRTKNVFWICAALTAVTSLVMSVGVYIFAEPLLKIYLPNEPDAIKYGVIRTAFIVLPHLIFGLQNTFVGQLRGLGYSMAPMIISIFGICVFRIFWIYTVFRQVGTLECLYLSYPISWVISLLAMAICYIIVSRRLPKDAEEVRIS